jgi:hypothetical protein
MLLTRSEVFSISRNIDALVFRRVGAIEDAVVEMLLPQFVPEWN